MEGHSYPFEKLEVWNLARNLSKRIYSITTDYPSSEQFGLVNQMPRAVVSVTSNIAEGTSRTSGKDQARFTQLAYSSLMELLNQLILSTDFGFLSQEKLQQIRNDISEISNKLNALRKYQLKQ
ncbi:four helix bundle protein [Luteibaculum oceani]|uniref:Four helix bundle protein n=1 Tax=Luteibaculum oceani TaxID=1294296 RepID=A0A5C6VAP3_9FLAO|nr:four helix bundle protein [Luteibaculum oceani]TXC81416.1 four helix bundle protein [Luteibaculum oceani]